MIVDLICHLRKMSFWSKIKTHRSWNRLLIAHIGWWCVLLFKRIPVLFVLVWFGFFNCYFDHSNIKWRCSIDRAVISSKGSLLHIKVQDKCTIPAHALSGHMIHCCGNDAHNPKQVTQVTTIKSVIEKRTASMCLFLYRSVLCLLLFLLVDSLLFSHLINDCFRCLRFNAGNFMLYHRKQTKR